VQSIFGNVAWSVVAVFLADFIHSDLRFSKTAATLGITIFGLGGLFGNIYGSKYGQNLFNKNKKIQLVYLLSVPGILGTIPMILLVTMKPESFVGLVTLLLGASVAAVPGPNLKGLLLAANKQESRAAVFSAFQLVEMLGKGAGPILVSVVAILANSRTAAMVICILGWTVSGLLCLELTKFIQRETQSEDAQTAGFSVFFDLYDFSASKDLNGNSHHKLV
jgi:predicted MFS family arabinose efflux permease